jgi:hypothetical protein
MQGKTIRTFYKASDSLIANHQARGVGFVSVMIPNLLHGKLAGSVMLGTLRGS